MRGASINICGRQRTCDSWCTQHDAAIVELTGFNHHARHGSACGGSDGGHIIGALDSDGNGLIDIGTKVIGHTGGIGLGDRGVFCQRLGIGVAVVEGVGPHTGAGVDGNAAIGGAGAALDRPGLMIAQVHVGSAQGACGRCHCSRVSRAIVQMAGFFDGTQQVGTDVGHDRQVVGAIDGDGDGLVGGSAKLVGHTGGVGFGNVLALFERLGGHQFVVQRVSPHPGRCDGDAAVGGAGCTGQRPGRCCGDVVHVGGYQSARDGGRTVYHSTHIVVARFGHAAFYWRASSGGDDRHVVGAVDGDGDGLISVSAKLIGYAGGVGFGNLLALLERLGGHQFVVQRVSPHPGRCDGDAAVGGAGCTGQRPGRCCGDVVHVGGYQSARDGGRTVYHSTHIVVARFGHAAFYWRASSGGDDRHVVGAVDGEGEGLINVQALIVGDADGVVQNNGLPLFEGLGVAVAVIQGVGPHARAGVDGHAAVSGILGALQRPGLGAAGVHIAGRQCAGGDVGAGYWRAIVFAAVFGDIANQCACVIGDDRFVIGTRHRDGDNFGVGGRVVVGDNGGKALSDRVAKLECLGIGVAVVEGVDPCAGRRINLGTAVSARPHASGCTLDAPGGGGGNTA